MPLALKLKGNIMRIVIPNDAYIATNTIEDAFIVQVLGNTQVGVIVAPTIPAADTLPDLILRPLEAISNTNVAGFVWMKSLSTGAGGTVGVTE